MNKARKATQDAVTAHLEVAAEYLIKTAIVMAFLRNNRNRGAVMEPTTVEILTSIDEIADLVKEIVRDDSPSISALRNSLSHAIRSAEAAKRKG